MSWTKVAAAVIVAAVLALLLWRLAVVLLGHRVGLEIEVMYIVDGKRFRSRAEFTILKYEGRKLRTIGLSVKARWSIKDPIGNPAKTQVRYIFIVFPVVEGQLLIDGSTVSRVDPVIGIYNYWRWSRNPINVIVNNLGTQMYNYIATWFGGETVPTISEVYDWTFCHVFVTSSYWKSFVETVTLLDQTRTLWLYKYVVEALDRPNTLLVDRDPEHLKIVKDVWEGVWDALTGTNPTPVDVSDGDKILDFSREVEGYKYYKALKFMPFAYSAGGEGRIGFIKLDDMVGRRIRIYYVVFCLFEYRDVTGEWSPWYYVALVTKPITLEVAEGTWLTVSVESTHKVWGWS